MSTDGFFAGQLAVAESSGNLRRLPRIGHDGKYVVVDGRRMLNLSSNDYLGIASDPGMPLMRDFLQETAAACQVSGTCRLCRKTCSWARLHQGCLQALSMSMMLWNGCFAVFPADRPPWCSAAGTI